MEKILKVKNLSVNFSGEDIIKNLSFEVSRGEVLTILGPNGAGKSTLLKALGGLTPYKGEIVWADKIKISYLPEELSRENFRVIPISLKEFFLLENNSLEKVKEIFALVGLPPEKFLKRRPPNLSSGEFQRMLIAYALVGEPDVLLFDEPTSGVDIGGRETIYSLLERFWKERNLTIFLVTHEINIVYSYSTNVLCLQKEKLCYGRPGEVLTAENLKELYGQEIKAFKHQH